MTVGPGRPYYLNHTFHLQIENELEWEYLWKQWLSWSLQPAQGTSPPPSAASSTVLPIGSVHKKVQPPTPVVPGYTKWRIATRVNIYMLGMVWKNVDLEKFLDWNGGKNHHNIFTYTYTLLLYPSTLNRPRTEILLGMQKSTAPIDLILDDWSIIASKKTPGIRLHLQYNNSGLVAANLGNLTFEVHSLYRLNNTRSQYVHLLNIQLPEFYYRPGINKFTVENKFLMETPKSIRSSAQLLMNYARNKTSTVSLRNFRRLDSSAVPGQVSWVEKVLGSISFSIELSRNHTLFGMSWMDHVKNGIKTTFEEVSEG
jgi:hypothetical protein